MARLEFKDSFRIDGAEIDSQHKMLFDLINEIATAMENREIGRCHALARQFIDAAKAHFTWEEQYLQSQGFPHVDDHARYHDAMVVQAEEAWLACEPTGAGFDKAGCYEKLVAVFVDDVVKGDLTFKSFLDERFARVAVAR